jgi:hypothetical protein
MKSASRLTARQGATNTKASLTKMEGDSLPMAKHHTTTAPWGALASILLALAIGSAPIIAALSLQTSIVEALS